MGHREDLLAGAKRCIYEKGYERTTARDIVAASGTNLASIGYHFGSKDALMRQALYEAVGEWGDELERVLTESAAFTDAGPVERFEAIWTRVIESFEQHRPLWMANFEIFGQVQRDTQARDFFAGAMQEARLGLAGLFHGFDPTKAEPTAQAVGSFYHALLIGIAAQWMLIPEHAPSGRDLANALRFIAAGAHGCDPHAG